MRAVARGIDQGAVDRMVDILADVRSKGGRLFILGVGGSAGNCSHAVNDFRKLCGIETYSPIDNVSELTSRTNDEGWDTVFSGWLEVSRLNKNDGLLIFSVGGGNLVYQWKTSEELKQKESLVAQFEGKIRDLTKIAENARTEEKKASDELKEKKYVYYANKM